MRILGIDPGTATTGFAILEKNNQTVNLLDYGCIITKPNQPLGDRLVQINENLDTLIKEWNPTTAAIEEIFFSKNVKTAISVAQARGSILHNLTAKKIDTHEYNPLIIKNTICGHGKAQKFEVQKMVQLTFNLNHIPKPDDAADAIAIAYCHATHIPLNKKLQAIL